MNNETFNFFDLPREVRDIVYAHLHTEISFQWNCAKTRKLRRELWPVEVTVKRQPILDIFLASRQMYRKYQKARYDNFAVIFENIWAWDTERERCHLLPQSTFYIQHVRHAILYASLDGLHMRSIWDEFTRSFRILHRRAPCLRSVRIVMQDYLNPNFADQPSEYAVTHLPYPYGPHMVDYLHEAWLNLPLYAVEGFPLKVAGQGHFIECDPGAVKPLSAEAESMFESLRNIRRVTMFLCEHDHSGSGAQRVWRTNDVFEKWPPEEYLEDELGLFSPNVAQGIRDRLGRMMDWTEQRGAGIGGRTNVRGQACAIVPASGVKRINLDDGFWEDDDMVILRRTLPLRAIWIASVG